MSSKSEAFIGDVDLGNLVSVTPTTTKKLDVLELDGEASSFPRTVIAYSRKIVFEGFLDEPTQEERELLLNLDNGEVYLADVQAFNVYGYGKVQNISLSMDNRFVDRYNYKIDFVGCPAIATTYIRTADVYLHDVNYRKKMRSFDPHLKRHNISYSADRLEATWQYYLNNDGTATQDAIVEIQCGDDINYLVLSQYNGSAWSPIGTWGAGGTAWGSTISFNDAGTIGHNVIANHGTRGSALTGIGTVSLKLGTNERILMLVGSLSADGTNTSTHYQGEQLYLKTKIVHTAAESGVRDYTKITYVDGSLDYGPT